MLVYYMYILMYKSKTLKAFASIYKIFGDFVGFKVQHDVHLYFKVQGGLINNVSHSVPSLFSIFIH